MCKRAKGAFYIRKNGVKEAFAMPWGFLLSACRWRLFGWLRFFKLNFSLIFNSFNFFAGFCNGLHTCFNV